MHLRLYLSVGPLVRYGNNDLSYNHSITTKQQMNSSTQHKSHWEHILLSSNETHSDYPDLCLLTNQEINQP